MSNNEGRKWRSTRKKKSRNMEDERKRKLYFGFQDNLNVGISENNLRPNNDIILPISTRFIGFFLQSVFIEIMTFPLLKRRCPSFIPDYSDVYAAYRVSLAQLERRIDPLVVDTKLYLHAKNSLYNLEILCPRNFVPIGDLISAVGKFEYNKIGYKFGIPKKEHAYPFNVTYSNLHDVVNELSNSDSDLQIRKYFYDNNPLPGAIWGPRNKEGKEDKSDNRWPILMNPKMFWPDNDPKQQLQEDIYSFSKFHRQLYPDLDVMSEINYKTEGDKCALVSTYCKNLRNPSFTYTSPDFENVDWENCCCAEGTLSNFWSSEQLTRDDFIKAKNLVGEIPFDGTDHLYGLRAKSYANTMHRQWKNFDYFTIFERYSSMPIPQVLNLKMSVLPVSTRSIGFFLQAFFRNMNRNYYVLKKYPIPECSIYEAYRVSLAQFEWRLLMASCYHLRETGPVKHYLCEDTMRDKTQNFSPIVNLINAVGKFIYRGIEYNFIIPRDRNVSPHNVSYTTLKHTVEMLGNPNTDQKIRKEFYDKSPLPGALWGPLENGKEDTNNENWPVLLNREDFWPVSNSLNTKNLLEKDYNAFSTLLRYVRYRTKYFDFFGYADIDYYNTNGVESALVSTHCINIRNQSIIYKQDGSKTIDWANCHYLSNIESDEFWTSVPLKPDAMFMGATILVGEIPPNRSDYPYGTRAMALAKTWYTKSWSTFINYPHNYEDYSSSSSD